jgi:anti-anti-sigma factor
MKITHMTEGDICTVNTEGQFAMESVSAIKKYMQPLVADENIKTLLIDFAQVGFIDSGGVGLVVMTSMSLKQRGANFALVNVNREVTEIFNLCGLGDQISIFATKDEAVAQFNP